MPAVPSNLGQPKNMMTARVVSDITELKHMRSEWNYLADKFSNPLLRHEWFLSAAQALHEKKDLWVTVVESQGKLKAVAPLVKTKRRGGERLELLGVSSLFEPCGLLYDTEESLQLLISALLKQKRLMYLQRMPAASPFFHIFSGLSKYSGLTIDRRTADSAWVRINRNWSSFYDSLSAQRKYDYRRARRRAEQFGRVECKVISPEQNDLESVFNAACEVEAKGWKGRKGSALLYNKKMLEFFSAYAAAVCRDNMLRVFFLYIAGVLAAMQICIEFAQRLWVLKIGYDEQWAKCSPGMQLTMEAIRYVSEKGLEAYEFLGVDEPWLHAWTTEAHAYRSIGFYPFRPAGLYAMSIDFVRSGAGKIFK